jgi:hypothetical protein
MGYLFMPTKEFLFCPVCNLVGKQDLLKTHLASLHQWSHLEVQAWFFAVLTNQITNRH